MKIVAITRQKREISNIDEKSKVYQKSISTKIQRRETALFVISISNPQIPDPVSFSFKEETQGRKRTPSVRRRGG
jgi:uncharacterized circularly permuted ATP-grasp superfamily protein